MNRAVLSSLQFLSSASGPLEQTGNPHADTNAHDDNHILDAAPLPFDQGMSDHAGAAHAVGVTDGDGTAIDIKSIVWDAEFVAQ